MRKYTKKNAPEKNVRQNLLTNISTIAFAGFTALSIALIFAGAGYSVVFVNLSILLSFIIAGWQVINLRNNLKLRKLLKNRRPELKSEKADRDLSGGSFYDLLSAESIEKNTSGSLL